jgi:peptide/nickel transport system ATP-binding protein
LLASTPVSNIQSPLLSLVDIRKEYGLRGTMISRLFSRPRSSIAAVDGVSIDLPEGCILGLVGESGSGKSTLAQIMVGLIHATSGSLLYRGADLQSVTAATRRTFRRDVQMVFQDTSASLNPRKCIGRTLSEALAACGVPRAGRPRRIAALMAQVALDSALLCRYPHEVSGGQRQRVGIARALATEPALLVADEPVSSLDVSLQGQIINLLGDLNRTLGLTIVLISHDLSVVARVCDRIAVMRIGRVVEAGVPDQVLGRPQDPYTRQLLASVPQGLRRVRRAMPSTPAGATSRKSDAGVQRDAARVLHRSTPPKPSFPTWTGGTTHDLS